MKPIWQSKRWMALVFTLFALVALQATGAPADVLMTLAGGLAVGLPVLLGAESWIDRSRVAEQSKTTEAANQNQLLNAALQMASEFLVKMNEQTQHKLEFDQKLEERIAQLEQSLRFLMLKPNFPPVTKAPHDDAP